MVNEPSVFEPLKFYCKRLYITLMNIAKLINLVFEYFNYVSLLHEIMFFIFGEDFKKSADDMSMT